MASFHIDMPSSMLPVFILYSRAVETPVVSHHESIKFLFSEHLSVSLLALFIERGGATD